MVKLEGDDEIRKFNKSNYPDNYSRVKINKNTSRLFSQYAKQNRTSKMDIMEEVLQFLVTNDIKLSDLWKLKDKMLIPKYHDFTAGFLQNFEANYVQKHIDFQEKAVKEISRLKKQNNYLTGIVQEMNALIYLLLHGAYEREEAGKIIAENKRRIEILRKEHLVQ